MRPLSAFLALQSHFRTSQPLVSHNTRSEQVNFARDTPRIFFEPRPQRGAGRHACNLARPTDRVFERASHPSVNETHWSRHL
ncbi:hypothetical protein B0T21DRAFT_43966 [Apiosordaria backusii]|uniref:Uncharacterized protein n=1 Tax=Apiosordaria backusii TaxID=314023 RepID=A0AA40E626_9PEZI|nr:hypothetical protein B0T21DRAFT_43966 [Apiosordaria backusii]